MLGEIPVAGFFCAGELGPMGGQNFLHGFTASIALFPEAACAQQAAARVCRADARTSSEVPARHHK
jgi:hypothetical protein